MRLLPAAALACAAGVLFVTLQTTAQAGLLDSSPHAALQCADCHGEQIPQQGAVSPTDAPAAAGRERLAALSDRCADCHRGAVVESYNASFHGAAHRLGDVTVATCVDCHGAHTVNGFHDEERAGGSQAVGAVTTALVTRSAANPDLALAPATALEACQGCHSGATANFIIGEEHRLLTDRQSAYPIIRWTWKAFLALLVFDLAFQGFVLLGNAWRSFRGSAARGGTAQPAEGRGD